MIPQTYTPAPPPHLPYREWEWEWEPEEREQTDRILVARVRLSVLRRVLKFLGIGA
jgi:hypothetical protein